LPLTPAKESLRRWARSLQDNSRPAESICGSALQSALQSFDPLRRARSPAPGKVQRQYWDELRCELGRSVLAETPDTYPPRHLRAAGDSVTISVHPHLPSGAALQLT